MIFIPVFNILVGVGLCVWGMYGYLQTPEDKTFPIPHVNDWHINLGLGILNLAVGIFLSS